MDEREFKQRVVDVVLAVAPELEITEVRFTDSNDAKMSILGRYGGKSSIIRVRGHIQGYGEKEFTVKRYLEGIKSIGGISPSRSHYMVEKSVLEATPLSPQTYLKALNYDDENMLIVFPGIERVTLEQMLHNNLIGIYEPIKKCLSLVENWRNLAYPSTKPHDSPLKTGEDPLHRNLTLQEHIEENLRDYSKHEIMGLAEHTAEDFEKDILRYESILKKEGIGLGNEKRAKMIEGLTKKSLIGPNTHDGYPWHNAQRYMIDAGDVKKCSLALHLGCLIGHHNVVNRIGVKAVDSLVKEFSENGPRWMKNDLMKSFPSCAAYGNMRELAGALTTRKIFLKNKSFEEYMKGGINCLNKYLERI